MNVTLEQNRKEWEEGLTVVAEKQPDEGTLLVILRREANYPSDSGVYACHRYFTIGSHLRSGCSVEEEVGYWTLSIDALDVEAETAMAWALNPTAHFRQTED